MALVLVVTFLVGGALLLLSFGLLRNRKKKGPAVRYVCGHCGRKHCECEGETDPPA
jgi:hypothetical protein